MENKGYADFGGQTRCIMGNVEMVNVARAFAVELVVFSSGKNNQSKVMSVLEESCQDRINVHKVNLSMISILITAAYGCSLLCFVCRLDEENAYIEVIKVLTLR